MTTMSASTITDRMRDYFNRQIACYETLIAELDALSEDWSAEDVERVAEQQACHARTSSDLENEFWALLPEWQRATETTPAERDEVRALAQRAESRAERLAQANARAEAIAGRHLDALKASRNVVARGRDMLGKYRGTTDDASGRFDSKA
jgi:hypothetical protein